MYFHSLIREKQRSHIITYQIRAKLNDINISFAVNTARHSAQKYVCVI